VATDDPTQNIEDLQFDERELYREETLTDLKVGSIRQLVPVTVDGKNDTSRRLVFVAQTQIMTQVGPVPVQAQIDARTLREAIEKFPEAIRSAIQNLMDEAREMQRQEASRIVVPGAEATSKILSDTKLK
jgi:hypothetical protein